MKIFVLGINYHPELIGIAVYNTEMCESLAELGHEVTVFTSFPYYPGWKKERAYRRKLAMTENHRGVKIRRSYLYVPSKPTTRTRILHELSFVFSSFANLLLSERPNVLITVSPPLGLGLVAYAIGRIKRAPYVFHIHDLQPDTGVELGMLKNEKLLPLLYRMEKFIYTKAGKVSVISKRMGVRVIEKGISKRKVLVFPNWVDTVHIKSLPKNNRFRQEHKLPEDVFVVLYSGNIGVKQGLDVVIDVARRTRTKKDIKYLVVGDGAYRKELRRSYEGLNSGNVEFLPVQPREELPYMLAAADVCLIPQQKTMTDVVMPSKLLGIMASGRPVIAGANVGSELYNVINNSGCGIVVEPESSEQMAEAIITLYNDHEKALEYGRKGREFAIKDFSKMEILKSFEREIRESIN